MNTDKIYAEKIASEYAPKQTSKIVALKKLDAKAAQWSALLEKLKKNAEKDLKNVEKEDFTDSSLASIRDEISQSVNKTIDYNLNLLKEEANKRITQISEAAAAEQVVRDRQYEMDVLALENKIINEVKERFGVELHPEVDHI